MFSVFDDKLELHVYAESNCAAWRHSESYQERSISSSLFPINIYFIKARANSFVS